MNRYSSSTLKLFTNNCPAALGFHERQEPRLTEIFQAGIAAHAVLQTIGEKDATEPEQQKAVADAVVSELITEGRAFKGIPEPPMSPEAAFEGRDIALAWLSWNELPAGEQETLLMMDGDGEVPAVDTQPRYDAIIDMVYPEMAGDEDAPLQTIVVRDYKSAWPTNADELLTLQRKGQAVLAWLSNPDVDGITREVVNLRTGGLFRETTWLDDEGIATLTQWRDDILTLCAAADATRAPRPGVGCITCPYVLRCDACVGVMGDSERPAVRYAVGKALIAATEPLLKEQAKEAPVPDGVGGLIGYQATNSRTVDLSEAAGQIAALWASGDIAGLVTAMKPGVGNIEKLGKVLFPGKDGKDARADFEELCLTPAPESKFTTWQG